MKKNLREAPVQELSSAKMTTSYFQTIWPAFLVLLLLCGCLWCLNGTWVGEMPSIWKQVVLATAGAVCCAFAKLGKKKYKFAWIGYFIPPVLLVLLASPARILPGAKAWIDVVIAQWNAVQEETTVVLSYSADESSLLAVSLAAAMCLGMLIAVLVLDRHPAWTGILCCTCLVIQLLTNNGDPMGCVLMLIGIIGLTFSGENLEISKLALLWVIGIGVVTCLCAINMPAGNLQEVAEARHQAGEIVNEIRYGQTSLPEGDLSKAFLLQKDNTEMMKVSSQQVKDLYLKGFTGSVYRDGCWEKTPESAYNGKNAGMLKWLKSYNFNPNTQVSRYYELSEENNQPEVNQLQIDVSGASRKYLYVPESVEDVQNISVRSIKDMRLMSRDFFGRKNYTVTERSTSKPSELAALDSWLYAPDTQARQEYQTAESTYRTFVYDNYVAVDEDLYRIIKKMFWDDYKTENDGIFSAVENIRAKMKQYFQYSAEGEDAEPVPDGEDPLLWFLTQSKTGNSVLYASAAVECLRVHGIPARYAEGYYISSSELAGSQGDSVAVSGQHAHAWVEVYFDGIGWMPMDVTPGYYYDTVNLQKMVAAPDTVRKNAALKDNSYKGEEIAGMEEQTGDGNVKTESQKGTAMFITAGICAIMLICATVLLSLLEVRRTMLLVRRRKWYRKADPEQKAILAEKEIERILKLWGISSSLGWETARTDEEISRRISPVKKGEYSRVCQILEKAVYGGEPPKRYESRTILAFIHKIGMPKKEYGIRRYLKLRYQI